MQEQLWHAGQKQVLRFAQDDKHLLCHKHSLSHKAFIDHKVLLDEIAKAYC